MNYIKKLGISFLYIIVPIISLIFIFSIFNYFGLISYKVFNVIRFIIFIIALLLGGFKMGENSKSRGNIEGLKLGLILSSVIFIINLINKTGFDYKYIFYYLIIIISTILGGIIGINMKKKNS